MAAKKQALEAQPSGGLTFTVTEPTSAIIVAVANLTAIIVQTAQSRYEGMDKANKDRADDLLLKAAERSDQVLEWIHKQIMGGVQ